MAIAVTALTNNFDNTDTTSYTTASISPAADSLLIVFSLTAHGTLTAPGITVSGLSLSWSEEVTTTYSGGVRRVACSRAICGSSPGSGTLTLTMTDQGGGTTSTGCAWAVLQVTGYDTGDPVVQSPTAQNSTGTAASVNLAAQAGAGSRVISWTGTRNNENINFQTNWAELTENNGTGPTTSAESQWRSDAFESPATSSWTTNNDWCIIALEIAAAAAGGVPTPPGIQYVKEVGSVTDTTPGTTSAITVASGGVPIGDTIVIYGACDNTGAAGIATTVSAADNSNNAGNANTYTLQSPQAIANPLVSGSPTVRGFATATNDTDMAPAGAITLPTRSAGDLLIAFIACDTTGTTITRNETTEWAQISEEAGSNGRLAVFARIATNDATDNLTVAGPNNNDGSSNIIAITTGTHGVTTPATDIVAVAAATGNDTAANPPNIDGLVSRDWLAIAIAGVDLTASGSSITAAPTNYTTGAILQKSASSVTSVGLGVGYRALTAAQTENPGTFTNSTGQWIAKTLLIPPTSSANAGQQGFFLVCPVTRSLDASDTITVTFGNSTTAKAINAQQFTGVHQVTPVLASSYARQDDQTGQSVSVATGAGPTKIAQAVCALVAVEGGTADSFTQDTDTTGGAWVTLTRRGSGTTTSGSTLNSAYKIVSATGTQTYDHATMLGTARDHCAAILVLDASVSSPPPRRVRSNRHLVMR